MAWRRCRCLAHRNMPCGRNSTPALWRHGRLGSTKSTAALQNGNTNLPTGTLYGQNQTFTILSNGQRMNAVQFGPMAVAYRNGSPVRLNELGHVIDSVQNDKTASWFNGVRAIVLAIQKQPGTNTVAVVDNIKSCCPGSKTYSRGRPNRYAL